MCRDEGATEDVCIARWRVDSSGAAESTEAQPAAKRQRHDGSDEAAAGDGDLSLLASLRRDREARHGPPAAAPSLGWRLNSLHRGWVEAGILPPRANDGTVGLVDLLTPAALEGVVELHIHNYMIDLDCTPRLASPPAWPPAHSRARTLRQG